MYLKKLPFHLCTKHPSAIEGHSEKAVEAHWSPKCCCLDLFLLITGILTAPAVVGPFQKCHCCPWNVISYFISAVNRLRVLRLSTLGLASQVPCTFILRTVSAIELELTIRPGWLTPAFPFPEYCNASTVSMSTWHFYFWESVMFGWCLSRPETMPAVLFSLPCFLKQGLLSLELIIWQTLLACEVPGSIPVPRVDWS